MGERLVCNQEVDGSSPFASTNFVDCSSWDHEFRRRGIRRGGKRLLFVSRGLFDIVKGGVVLCTTVEAGDFGRSLWRLVRTHTYIKRILAGIACVGLLPAHDIFAIKRIRAFGGCLGTERR